MAAPVQSIHSDLEIYAKSALLETDPTDTVARPACVRGVNASVMRDGVMVVSFGDEDYLGLTQDPRVIAAAGASAIRYGAGAGSAREMNGNGPLLATLEDQIAKRLHLPASKCCESAEAAVALLLKALSPTQLAVVVDEGCRPALVEAAGTAGLPLRSFRRNSVSDLQGRIARFGERRHPFLVLTEAAFVSDGAFAPLEELSRVTKAAGGWLMADVSATFGVVEQPSQVAALQVGSLAHAIGTYGGFVAGPAALIKLVSQVQQTAFRVADLPPQVVGASIEALSIIDKEPELKAQAVQHCALFARMAGVQDRAGPILFVPYSDLEAASRDAEGLFAEGFYVPAVKVPGGGVGLRFSFSAMHSEDDIKDAALVFQKLRINQSSN